MKNKNAWLAVALLVSGMIPAAAQPTLSYTSAYNGPGSVPDNLLAGVGTLASSSGSFNAEQDPTLAPLSQLTDNLPGAAFNSGPNPNSTSGWVSISSNSSLTYALNTSSNTFGYDIDQIDLFSGWGDFGRANILNVNVSYQLVGSTTWTTLLDGSTIANQNLVGGGTGVYEDVNYVNLDGTTPLITNVGAVKFDFGSQQNGYVGYRELDIEGVASLTAPVSAPEPSSVALVLFGLAGLILRNRFLRSVRLS